MRRARLIGTVGVAVLVLSGCGALTPVTEQGRDIHGLYNILFAVAAVIFVLVEAAIVFAVVRYRRRSDMLPPQFHGNNLLEIVWTVVPLLIVATLFVLTWGVLARVDAKADNPRVTVNIVGFQWQWQFTYEGERVPLPAGQKPQDLTIKGTIAKPPVMYLPVGEPIRFTTEAQDVIHSFYVREFLFKRDAFPGHLNTFDITITKPGDFGGQCTEYCGLAHQAMRFTVRAVPRPQFEAWLSNAKKEAVPHHVVFLRGAAAAAPPILPETETPPFPGPKITTYKLPALKSGSYFFHCQVHPAGMQGKLVVQSR